MSSLRRYFRKRQPPSRHSQHDRPSPAFSRQTTALSVANALLANAPLQPQLQNIDRPANPSLSLPSPQRDEPPQHLPQHPPSDRPTSTPTPAQLQQS